MTCSIANLDQVLDRVRKIAATAPQLPLDGLKLLSPVANPGKIIAAPVNYQKHLDEVKGDVRLHQDTQAHTDHDSESRAVPEGHQLAGRSG